MNIILNDHSAQNLENTFDAIYLNSCPLFSLMAEKTELPWLLVIPKQALDSSTNLNYIQQLYGDIYRLTDFLLDKGYGPKFNLAKIGNKNPLQHIHLVFRNEEDECWPDAIWCHEPLKASENTANELKAALADFFQ
ncbi:hypothetical protein [Thiomicrorhabdus sediminis]|uniref:Diadenosine tetraphosphate (Ap4A) hydrolase n=1 Tax=Thiomicrorhabdus sediminis TaxID=2580412 RepID=A0A4P9K707_9GAMM|nr:hypothetical protein [Thiomicrorhabdus sediminis]QCU90698.1 hypothetical protein FE785_08685 [Thiomicrorhabdus sediminis]